MLFFFIFSFFSYKKLSVNSCNSFSNCHNTNITVTSKKI
nr:MAG TPA: hypothetical protein [Caudoviricetes sp.]